MNANFPIEFDCENEVTYSDGNIENTEILRENIPCKFPMINGYDSQGNRATNLVGVNENGVLLKYCPHCGDIKTVYEFDYEGRTTNEHRDQSWCSACR